MMPNEFDISPIAGVKIEMPKPCKCLGPVAYVRASGELKCTACGRHRGWLPKDIAEVLLWTTQTFGALDRRCVHVRIKKHRRPIGRSR
jgi:hypothetical protein